MGSLTADLHPAMEHARAAVAPVRGPSFYQIKTAPRARRKARAGIEARGISRLRRCLIANLTLLRTIVLGTAAPPLLDGRSMNAPAINYDAVDYALERQENINTES